MARSLKALALAGIAVIGLGVMPGIAAAGHDHGVRRGGGHGYKGRFEPGHGGDWRARAWHRDAHRHGHHAGPPRYRGRPHGAPAYRHKHDDGGDLWPILAIGAIGVTAAVLATRSYAEPAPAAPPVTYAAPPPPPPAPVAAPIQAAGPAATCLMTREYQTQVTVGGRLVEAYGQACLQPDGSWYRGPAQPVPY